MIEDGNFDIPSVYLSEEEGLRLAAFTGNQAVLTSHAERIPSHGWNSVARLNPSAHRKVILCAHIDTKPNTPGALSSAPGVITLMLLAELLKEHPCRGGVEIVCMNGEDHYAAKGETVYMETIPKRLFEIGLVINLDGLGYAGSQTAFSMYECPDELAALIRQTLAGHDSLCEGEAWYQGDHTMFLQVGLPCVALTTHDLAGIMSEITHTPKDSPDKVDPTVLAQAAFALRDLLYALDG